MTYDPTMRVLTVLELLQASQSVTGAQLAARLEVHPRTVQRYVARLQDLGVPVTGSRGVGGAYRLRPGFRLPPMMFSGEEALALMLGLRALRDLGLSAFAPALEGASAKLRRVLPVALAEQVSQTEGALDLDVPWRVEADATRVLGLAAAVHQRASLRLEYEARDGKASVRDVEPYAVMRDEGRWYLVGLCRLRGAIRCFRIDRIAGTERLGETFRPPDSLDARAILRASLAATPSRWQVCVWAALAPEAVREGLPLLRPGLEPLDGGTLIRCGVEHLEHFAAQLLGLGCSIRVQEPPELLGAFGSLAKRSADVQRLSGVSALTRPAIPATLNL